MKIDEELILPYSLAIGFFNMLLTSIITLVVSCWIFHFPLTWKLYFENFVVGYIILWIFNLKTIKE